MKQKVQVTTLGCKVNQAESEALAAWYRDRFGCRVSQRATGSQLCIINTCAVTGKAEMQSRQAVRKAVRDNPGAAVVATGCCVQRDPEAFASMEGVDYIVGHADKHRIPELLNPGPGKDGFCLSKNSGSPLVFCSNLSEQRGFDPMPAAAAGSRTRPFLKIQDGCDSFCTYCIVPYTRGRSRSREPDSIISEFMHLVSTGAPEIVLSGIHIGRYGADLEPRTDLAGLLRLIDKVEGNHRIRLSSIEPTELTDELLDIIADSGRICPHFHVPLQSGDPEILKRMHRPYGPDDYMQVLEKIRHRFPDAAIGADVLIGFPGEDSDAFNRTFKLIDSLPVTYLHVFPYSQRPGTPAAGFSDQLPPQEIRQRSSIMKELGRNKKRRFFSRMAQKTMDVVIEGRDPENKEFAKGLSSNYIPVIIENASRAREGMRVSCRITESGSDRALYAEAVSTAAEAACRADETAAPQAQLS
ncbi:MAG: tRNA (N(6)-L-threonylcarbamoyladenosine(37)-C(2))-methylthiotransferase MtaB [Desulfosalsimonas sp.]